MASRYRKVDPRFWKDEGVRQLDATDKAIALYCITAQSNRIGLFNFSPGQAAEDLDLPMETFRERFRNVCLKLHFTFDEGARSLYLPTWWKYNAPENPNVLIGNLKDLDDLPETLLISRFCANLEYLDSSFHQTFREGIGKRYPQCSSNQEQEQEHKQEQKQEHPSPPSVPQGGDRHPSGDDAFGVGDGSQGNPPIEDLDLDPERPSPIVRAAAIEKNATPDQPAAEQRTAPQAAPAVNNRTAHFYTPEFDAWWNGYPNKWRGRTWHKGDKDTAFNCWKDRSSDEYLAADEYVAKTLRPIWDELDHPPRPADVLKNARWLLDGTAATPTRLNGAGAVLQ